MSCGRPRSRCSSRRRQDRRRRRASGFLFFHGIDRASRAVTALLLQDTRGATPQPAKASSRAAAAGGVGGKSGDLGAPAGHRSLGLDMSRSGLTDEGLAGLYEALYDPVVAPRLSLSALDIGDNAAVTPTGAEMLGEGPPINLNRSAASQSSSSSSSLPSSK
jgi:hypothetical protein